MNRSVYTFAIFLLGLAAACGVFQSILQFQIQHRLFYLQPFADWFLVTNIIALGGIALLLRYFHYRKYRFAFWAGLSAAVVMLCQIVVVYIMLIFVIREYQAYGMLLVIPFLATSIVFATSLTFSSAGKRPWLKAAGVIMLILHTVFGAVFIRGLISQEFLATATFATIERWIALLSNVILVCFIMDLRSESRSPSAVGAVNRPSPNSEAMLAALGLIALAFTFFLGLSVARQSYWVFQGERKGHEKAIGLANRFEARTHVNSRGDSLHYLFKKPLGYDPQKTYPLVVCLHGGPVQDRQVEIPEPAPFLSDPANSKKYPAFLLVPQGPPGHTWGGIPALPAVDTLVFETMASLEEEFSIDASRRYVAGGSMGGYGAWYFIGTRPEMFAAAIPYCGAGDPALAKNIVGIPVWAFHGSADRNVSVNGSREMIEAIRKAGGDPRYTEFPGTGHNVWPEISRTPGVLEWLFAQRRE